MASSRKEAATAAYTWTQTYEEFVLRTPLPQGISRRQIKSIVRNKALTLKIGEVVVADGQLHESVSVDNCVWSIEDGMIELILEKSYSGWWEGLIVGEVYIETPKGVKKIEEKSSEKVKAGVAKSSTRKTLEEEGISNPGMTLESSETDDKKSTASTKIGSKGHGEINELGNEGEDISKILEKEKKCKDIFDSLKQSLGIDHEATLNAAFNLMDQWIGNYRMSKIDNLLNNEGLMKLCRTKGGQWKMKAVQMLAFCRWKQFRFRESLNLFYEFQDLAGKSAILLENMGHTHNSLGEHEKAEACFTEALERISKGDRGNKGGLLMGLGVLKKARGDYKGSVKTLLEALQFFKDKYKGIEHSIVAKCHTSVGRSLEALGEIHQAEHHFFEAVRIFWLTCAFSPLTANAAKKLADLKFKLGFVDEAQQLYKQSLQMHVSFDTLDLRALLEIIQLLPELHLDRKFEPYLCEPGLDQYAASLRKLKERIDDEKIPMDGTLAVLFKSMAELSIAGHSYKKLQKNNATNAMEREMAAGLLRNAIEFFKKTEEVDCTQLITQCERLIVAIQPPLS